MDDSRRKFLTLTGLGLALATPARALAQSPRILREPSNPHAGGPAHASPELQSSRERSTLRTPFGTARSTCCGSVDRPRRRR
jgi:hypothetical protein